MFSLFYSFGRTLLVASMLLCLMGSAYGQGFRVDHIGVAQGLTQGSVYYMHKDSRGFMWFGTQDGLNRYDGHTFRTFRPDPVAGSNRRTRPALNRPTPSSIHGINIMGIVETPNGDLWVGTEEGLNRYDRLHDRFTCLKAQHPQTGRPINSRTLPFFADKHELLYLSDTEGLVSLKWQTLQKQVLDPTLKPAQEYDLQSSTVRTPAGDVWLHAAKGVIRYNLKERRVHTYFSDGPDNEAGTPLAIFSFYIDKNGVAWLGTATNLIRFDYRTCVYKTYQLGPKRPISPVYSLAEDQTNLLWMGTQANGLLYFDKRTERFGAITHFTSSNQRLRTYEISKVYVDDQGIVWANVDPDGLARVVPNSFLFEGMLKSKHSGDPAIDPPHQLSNYSIRAFLEESPRRIWVATEKGINVFDPVTKQIVERYLTDSERSALPMHNFIKSIYRDWRGKIWIGSIGGAMCFDPVRKSVELAPFPSRFNSLVAANYVRNLVSIDSSTLAAATEDGLYTLHLPDKTWVREPTLLHKNLFSFWFDAARRQLWIGTYLHGFAVYQLPPVGKPGPWRQIRLGLEGATVLHMQEDPNRPVVWISTNRGLACFDQKTGKIQLYGERQGLANSFVYGALCDTLRNVWVSTNRGISRLNPEKAVFTNFKLTDGLQGYEFNGNALMRSSDGRLYFGGVNGFNYCRPEAYHSSRFNPRVHIYNLKVNEEPFAPGNRYVGEVNEIDLSHEQNTISLEFSALDNTSTGYNTYQYQMTGYEDRWVQVGENNYVRYANLPPGDYTFQVKAANKDNHWSHHVRQLHIRIRPPFWSTWPFILLALGSLSGLILWYVRHREALIRQKEAERVRLAYDVQEQTKKSIARDLHDEIGTRLATLKLYTSQLVQHTPESNAIRTIKANMFGLINDTITDVRNLLRKLDPQTLERHGYVAAVEELFDRVNATETVKMNLNVVQAPARLSKDTSLMLYRITQELLNNSLKHAGAEHIGLVVRAQEGSLQLEYSDDGKGFDYDRSVRGLGIGNIESRVAMLHGKINWQTQPGKGTKAIIDVPIRGTENTAEPQTSITTPSVSG